jgi:bifunctional non-homologous end joining protein LigD
MKATTQITKPSKKDKVLFPESGITKNDVINYYDTIADYILPYLSDRPLTMQRFPKGITEGGFFQKNASDYFPDWIETVNIKKEGGWVHHVVCNTKETLLYLVNQYVLTFHVTLSKIDTIQNPDKLIFDLDPPKENFELAIKAAKALRYILEEELGLKAYITTTGSKGLHVATPIKPDKNFDEVHQFAKQVATYACVRNPKEFTTAIRKDKREGRLYIDFIRNSYAQTSVCPFSIRALEKAPVATPLSWNELNDTALNAQTYTISSIFKRLETTGNPWKDFEKHAKSITSAKEKSETLVP